MSVPSRPSSHSARHHLTLAQLQRVKNWHEGQHAARPVEYQVWQAVMTLWVMGCMGWLPAFVLEAAWAYPLCLLGVFSPRLYVDWRARANALQRLRCDWLDLLA
jgi:hypothetical protein